MFSPAVNFSNDNWVIDGCPEDGPSVADKNKNTYATWFTGGKIKGMFYAELNNEHAVVFKKQISNNSRFIQLCLIPGGERIIAYNETVRQADSIYSKIMINRVDDKNQFFTADVTRDNEHSNYPVLCSLDTHHIVVAWANNNNVYSRVMNTDEINKAL